MVDSALVPSLQFLSSGIEVAETGAPLELRHDLLRRIVVRTPHPCVGPPLCVGALPQAVRLHPATLYNDSKNKYKYQYLPLQSCECDVQAAAKLGCMSVATLLASINCF